MAGFRSSAIAWRKALDMLPELLLYDHLHVRGGAENFTLLLRDALPDLRVVVAAAEPALFPPTLLDRVQVLDEGPIRPGAAARSLNALRRFNAYRPGNAPAAVLLSGHYAPLSVARFEGAVSAIYLHAWPLHLLPGEELSGFSPAKRAALTLFQTWYAPRWRRALRMASVVIANSTPLAQRVARDCGVAAQVLPPPVDTDRFRAVDTGVRGEAYLSFARHEPQKRVELVIEAFLRMPRLLLRVASSGSQTARLRQLAAGAGNIEFVGDLEPDQLVRQLARCRATLHASRQEPFSMAMIESLACGKPVIACADAGAVLALGSDDAMVLPLPAEPRVEDIIAAVERCERLDPEALAVECRRRAEHFRISCFVERLAALLASAAINGPGTGQVPKQVGASE